MSYTLEAARGYIRDSSPVRPPRRPSRLGAAWMWTFDLHMNTLNFRQGSAVRRPMRSRTDAAPWLEEVLPTLEGWRYA